MSTSSYSSHGVDSSRVVKPSSDPLMVEPQSSHRSNRSADGNTERQATQQHSTGSSHTNGPNSKQFTTVDTNSSSDVQRVEKMVKGIEDVEAKFKEVLSQLYRMLEEPGVDVDAIQPLCAEWTELQRTFSRIKQDSNKLATRGTQTIKDFIDHCKLVAKTDCPIDDRIKSLRDFKLNLERDDNILGGKGEAMYDIDSAFNDLRRDVQNFGFRLLAVRQPIDKDILAQIASLEGEISKITKEMKFLKKHISDRGGGIKVILSAFLRVNLQQLTEKRDETIDNPDDAELDRKREELDEVFRRKNAVERQWASISHSCSEYIQQIGGQLGAISDIWKGLSSDVLMLEEQLNSNVREGINPHLFEIKLQTTSKMYERLYDALMAYTHSTLKAPLVLTEEPSAGMHPGQSVATSRSPGSRKSLASNSFDNLSNQPTCQTHDPVMQKPENAPEVLPKQPSPSVTRSTDNNLNTPRTLQHFNPSSDSMKYPPKTGKAVAPATQNLQYIPVETGDQPTRINMWKRFLNFICPCLATD